MECRTGCSPGDSWGFRMCCCLQVAGMDLRYDGVYYPGHSPGQFLLYPGSYSRPQLMYPVSPRGTTWVCILAIRPTSAELRQREQGILCLRIRRPELISQPDSANTLPFKLIPAPWNGTVETSFHYHLLGLGDVDIKWDNSRERMKRQTVVAAWMSPVPLSWTYGFVHSTLAFKSQFVEGDASDAIPGIDSLGQSASPFQIIPVPFPLGH